MDTDTPDWLLRCKPRPAQLEALRRSYRGLEIWQDVNTPTLPKTLSHYPHPAQGWAHFMEMRVGKTPTVLNEFMLFRRDHNLRRLFVLTPSHYQHAWGREFERFVPANIPVYTFVSRHRKKFQHLRYLQEYAFIVHYEALLSKASQELFVELFKEPVMLVCDESAMIKNPNSIFSKWARILGTRAAVKRVLSGFPAPNGPQDLWAQLKLIDATDREFYPFRAQFTTLGGFKGRQVVGTRNQAELEELLQENSFRAKRKDWGGKIESDYEVVDLGMTKEQKKAYKEMDDNFMLELQGGQLLTVGQVITKRMKLQQISSGFVIKENGEVETLVPFTKTSKFKHLLNRLENEISGKVLIVAHYKATIRLLMESLVNFYPLLMVNKSMSTEFNRNLETEKEVFNSSPQFRVLIGQSQTLKYGHTLVGTEKLPCTSICFFENDYNLDTRVQCENRPQGDGQKSAIHIWDYQSSLIEVEIIQALQKKHNLVDAIMNGTGQKRPPEIGQLAQHTDD